MGKPEDSIRCCIHEGQRTLHGGNHIEFLKVKNRASHPLFHGCGLHLKEAAVRLLLFINLHFAQFLAIRIILWHRWEVESDSILRIYCILIRYYPSILQIISISITGGVLGWFGFIPLISHLGSFITQTVYPASKPLAELDHWGIWSYYLRYIGAGAVASGLSESCCYALTSPVLAEYWRQLFMFHARHAQM